MEQVQTPDLDCVEQAWFASSQLHSQVGQAHTVACGDPRTTNSQQQHSMQETQLGGGAARTTSTSSSRNKPPSPFSLAATQLAEQLKPVRLSCPGALGPQDLQHQRQQQAGHADGSEQSEPWQLSGMLSSSWCDSGSGCFSRQSCSTASVRSMTSSPLQQEHQHGHDLLLLEQQTLLYKLPAEHHQQQHAELGVSAPPPARAASCTPYSPCCSTSSDFGDLCCCNIVECSRAASAMSLVHSSTDYKGAGRSGSNSSTQSSNTQRSDTSNASSSTQEDDAHAEADAARAAAGAARGSGDDGDDGDDTAGDTHDDDDDDDAAGNVRLCRTVSAASSVWSSKSQHVASRPAPGGVLGHGIPCVLPQYCGREVLADYEFGQTLGCGTFGVTRLVTHRKTASMWACKTICKASIAASPAAQSDVQHEVAILRHLRGHQGIVQLKGVYEDERNIHLVMELCTGGDLLDYISRFGRLQEGEAADVASVMLSTLAHCHRLGVVHRDIKPENFLLGAPTLLSAPAGTAASVLKISDFGVSAFHNPNGEMFSEIVGTPFYMAPEVLERCYGPEADVWSVGVVVFLMLAGRLPFDGATDRQIIKAVLDSDPDFGHPAWAGISAAAQDCVASMLVKDPARRATVAQLLSHPWLAGRMRSSCCSHAGDSSDNVDSAASANTNSSSSYNSAATGFAAQQPCCGGAHHTGSSSSQHSSGHHHKVCWASPCVTELESSGSSPLLQAPPPAVAPSSSRERRDSSPTPRRPPPLSPLKHVRSRLGDDMQP